MTLQVFKCCVCIWIGVFSETMLAQTQKVVFSRDFSPAEGLVTPQEKPYRDEVCLNGLWDLQCVAARSVNPSRNTRSGFLAKNDSIILVA